MIKNAYTLKKEKASTFIDKSDLRVGKVALHLGCSY